MSNNINWVNNSSGAATLIGGNGSAVDFARFGASTVSPPAGTNWTGTNPPGPAAPETLGRDAWSTDTDDGSDWCAQTQTLGAQNPGCGGGGDPTGNIKINELDVGDPDAIELYNADSQAINMMGWHFIAYSSAGAVYVDYIFPSFTLQPGAYVVLHEGSGTDTATDLYMNGTIVWVNNSSGAAALIGGDGNGTDFVRFGSSTLSPPAGTNWTGTNPAGPPYGETLGRDQFSTDTDDGSDWCAQTETLGAQNLGCGGIGDPTGNIKINELDVGAADAIELYNADSQAINMTGWSFKAYTAGAVDVDYTFPGFTLAPGAYVVLHETSGTDTATDLYMGDNIFWINNDSGAAALTGGNGSAVDFVRFGISTVSPPAGTSWTGTNPPGPAAPETLGRDPSSTDTDDGSDWCTQPQTLGAQNLGCLPSPALRVVPADQDVKLSGGSFDVDIVVEDVTHLGAFQFDLVYDPAIVNASDVTLGAFLGSSGCTVTDVGPFIDNVSGRVTYAANIVGTCVGPSGDGVVATVTLQPVAVGDSALTLENEQLWNSDSPPAQITPVLLFHGHVEVIPCFFADVDCDGDVDIGDIYAISYRWGTSCGDAAYDPVYDLDNDCDVDIIDILIASCYFGWPTGDFSTCYVPTLSVETPDQPSEGMLQSAVVRIDPNLSLVANGETFRVDVVIEDAQDLAGFEIVLDYDPAVLEVPTAVNPMILGPFLDVPDRSVVELMNEIDPVTGVITYVVGSFGAGDGPDGDGTLASVDLTARALGSSDLDLVEVQIGDTDGNPQTASVGDGRVIVAAAPISGQVLIQKGGQPATAAPDDLLTYTLQRSLVLTGTNIKYDEWLFDPIPNNTEYVPGSATLNGLAAPQLYSDTQKAIVYQGSGFFTDTDQLQISFQVSVTQVPSGTLIVNTVTETVSFDGAAYTGPYTDTVSTRVTCAAPGTPALSSPADDSSTCDMTPDFAWSTVSGADAYRIQVDNNADFSSPEIDTTSTSASFTPGTALAPGTYYWRVQASNACTNGDWSASRQFTIDYCLYVPLILKNS
jgi:hypothetical protein